MQDSGASGRSEFGPKLDGRVKISKIKSLKRKAPRTLPNQVLSFGTINRMGLGLKK